MGERTGGPRRQRRDGAGRQPRPLHTDARAVARDPHPQRRENDGTRGRRGHHALAQPATRRRLQVQPARRRARGQRHHRLGAGPGERLSRQGSGRCAQGPARPGSCGRHHCHVRLSRRVRRRPALRARPRRCARYRRAHRRRPPGWRQRRLLGRDRRSAPARPDGRQPARRPDVALHDARLGRQDPHGLFLPVRHGEPHCGAYGVRHRDRQRRGRRPARHRDAGRRAAEPQPLPRRGDRVRVRHAHRLAGGCCDRQDRGELEHDRPGRSEPGPPARRGTRRLQVVRPRPAGRVDRVRRRGERRSLVPPPRRTGLDDRQGRHPAVPAGLGDHRDHRRHAR